MQADEAFDGEVRSHAAHRLQGLGERLLGSLLDRAHWSPPDLVATLIAEEVAYIGGRDVAIYLQDYDQLTLVPLPGDGLEDNGSEAIDGSFAGRAFSSDLPVERPEPDGVRLFLPMLDGSDRVGVLAYSLSAVGAADRQLAGWLAGLVANLIVTKGLYTDHFFLARRRRPMRLEAEMQWHLLPPLTMETPQVGVAGILEPAYEVGGDSFDYALNGQTLHVAIIDAMGHGLNAAIMATVSVGAYRHARRAGVGLADLYAAMDSAVAEQFGEDTFVTAQMAQLDCGTGRLSWVNAGHHPPLLLRRRRVLGSLNSETTLPVGFGGAAPQISEVQLEPYDRVLLFTDGVIEERMPDGERFGQHRLVDLVGRVSLEELHVQETVRRLSHSLMRERGGATSDDASLFLLEWRRTDTP
ncbi:MAG: SpoIIE family protein phosphatase [Actinomycetota bacterium]|nr:SpoIIE family protein phosphatase [Actinomycetota bacterium]